MIATTTNVQLGINLSLRLFDKRERALAGAAVMMRLRNSHLPWTLWYRGDIYSLSTFFVDSGTFLRLWIQRDQTTRRKSEDNFWHFPSSVSIIGSESLLNKRKRSIMKGYFQHSDTCWWNRFSKVIFKHGSWRAGRYILIDSWHDLSIYFLNLLSDMFWTTPAKFTN